MALQGYIHQLESFGCADGPGSRFIIFFAGCPFRCLYCHNPDTWEMTKGKLYSADELLSEAEGCRDFWGKKGGITVSGGEPLAQIDFSQRQKKKTSTPALTQPEAPSAKKVNGLKNSKN